jgi:plasmid stabilization system protein ParE
MKKTFDVVITNSAEMDFLSIWNYISHDSPSAALNFINQIEEKIYTLENSPERCPIIPENNYFQDTVYRHLIFKDYRIIFAIKEKTVFIHRVFHGVKILNSDDFDNF